jgi:hypothetical protein
LGKARRKKIFNAFVAAIFKKFKKAVAFSFATAFLPAV